MARNAEHLRTGPASQSPTSARQKLETAADRPGTTVARERSSTAPLSKRSLPVSPNIQLYRPQLTSVLSIANRITGVIASIAAIGLVAWLVAGAVGPEAYAAVQGAIYSWIGQIVLFVFTFAFFLHLCGGIRHLIWDTVHAFELRQIYIGGWLAVAASVVLTIITWVVAYL